MTDSSPQPGAGVSANAHTNTNTNTSSGGPEAGGGLDLSAREIAGLYRSMQAGDVDEAQVQQIFAAIPPETKQQAVMAALDNYVVPHFHDIRSRQESDPDNERIRAKYAELSDDEQQEVFNTAVAEVVGALFEVRESPQQGLVTLKKLLRDPYTVEGLLLIFDNDEHIDPAYSEQIKNFAATHLRWAGCALMPEAYDPEVVRQTGEEIGLDLERARQAAQSEARSSSNSQ